MDIARGMRQAIAHLHGLGHRRCAYLGGPAAAWSNRERLRGLHAAAQSTGLDLVELGPFEPKFEGGIEGADRAVGAGVTALVAYNDLMALGALRRLAERGVRVPDAMSVVGFDDLLFASMCAPPLTTVTMPMESAGRAAVDLLLARIAAAPPAGATPTTELTTQLIVRGTQPRPRHSRPSPVRRRKPALPKAAQRSSACGWGAPLGRAAAGHRTRHRLRRAVGMKRGEPRGHGHREARVVRKIVAEDRPQREERAGQRGGVAAMRGRDRGVRRRRADRTPRSARPPRRCRRRSASRPRPRAPVARSARRRAAVARPCRAAAAAASASRPWRSAACGAAAPDWRSAAAARAIGGEVDAGGTGSVGATSSCHQAAA